MLPSFSPSTWKFAALPLVLALLPLARNAVAHPPLAQDPTNSISQPASPGANTVADGGSCKASAPATVAAPSPVRSAAAARRAAELDGCRETLPIPGGR
jgi:hypothetical protein